MTGRRKKGPISATELMAQLRDDPEYQRSVQSAESERQVKAEALRRAELPIVDDLRSAGVQVGSAWDLVNFSEPYPNALPVLMEHLEHGGYPARVMESLGRALAVRPSVAYWDRIRTRWLEARDSGEEDGTAVALAACATKAQIDDLIRFLTVEQRGSSRIYFIGPILKVGGERGRAVVEALREDPIFGDEATALLKRRTTS